VSLETLAANRRILARTYAAVAREEAALGQESELPAMRFAWPVVDPSLPLGVLAAEAVGLIDDLGVKGGGVDVIFRRSTDGWVCIATVAGAKKPKQRKPKPKPEVEPEDRESPNEYVGGWERYGLIYRPKTKHRKAS